MRSTIPTESSCPGAQCPGQLSFSDIDDEEWVDALIYAFQYDGWTVVARDGERVTVQCNGKVHADDY